MEVAFGVEDQEAPIEITSGLDREESKGGPAQCTFLRLVQQQADQQRSERFCVWLDENLTETDSRLFGELWEQAAIVAGLLADEGVAKGDRVVLCFNFGLGFLDAFLGCLRLGAIAVPVYPPNPMKLSVALKKLSLIVEDSGAKVCLMDKAVARLRASTKGWPSTMVYKVPKPNWKDPVQKARVNSLRLDAAQDHDVAFLQYTSGSTGDPKGVMLTYGNIYSNMRLSNSICPHLASQSAVNCSWLPQFHDMGLLFCTLYPLARGQRQVFMSPTVFIKHPVSWLVAMSQYECTWTIAPNFAYGLAARKYGEMQHNKRPRLELSRVEVLGNAAEPIRQETMREFVEVFKDSGVHLRSTFFSCYGLAEHTVAATTGVFEIAKDPSLAAILDRSGKFVCTGVVEAPAASRVVDVRIVHDGQEVEDGKVGEIWLRSASCGRGYWGMEERSAEVFRAQLRAPLSPLRPVDGLPPSAPPLFTRTGDEGFIEAAEGSAERRLYVCGRAKDVLIIRGKNLYPQDLEATAESAAGGRLRLNCSAAFQSTLGDGGELEAADLVCEAKSARMKERALHALCESVVEAVRGEHGVRVRRLVVLKARSIPKTTSGKIQRKGTRAAVETGELMRKALVVWEDAGAEEQRRQQEPPTAEILEGQDAEGAVDRHVDSFLVVVVEELGRAAGLEAEAVSAHEGSLLELGLDSVSTHSLGHSLSVRLGAPASPEDIIAADSVRGLAERLLARVEGRACDPPAVGSELSRGAAPGACGASGARSVEADAGGAAARGPFASFSLRRDGPSASRRRDSFVASFRKTIAPDEDGSAREEEEEPAAGAASIAVRVVVQVALIFWVLLGLSLCALPAIIGMERISDLDIFPFFLFRTLLEPTFSAPAVFHSWGEGNGLALSAFPSPPEPLVKNALLALPVAVICAAGSFLVTFAVYVVLLKWLLLGRVAEGDYPLWGAFYWRRWLVQRHLHILFHLLAVVLPHPAPLSVLYALLGARVGARCDAVLDVSGNLDLDLVRLGDAAAVSGSASLLTGVVVSGVLRLRRVEVGEACDVGSSAVLCPGTVLPPCTKVGPLSVVTSSAAALASSGATLSGIPARVAEGQPQFAGSGGLTAFDMLVLPAAWLLFVMVQAATCVLPIVAVHTMFLDGAELSGVALVAVAVMDMSLYLLSLCLFTLLAKWLLLGRSLRPGARVPPHSSQAVARECVHRLNSLVARFVLMYAWGGSWINLWYRLMGARIGDGAVLSAGVVLSDWDAVDIGPGCLLGGGSTLEASTTCSETGDRLVTGVKLEEGVTVGANALVSAGSSLRRRAMVGLLSYIGPDALVPEHAVVLGSTMQSRAKRCYVPRHGIPWRMNWVTEILLWVLYTAWTILAVWSALYIVWSLRSRASWPGMVLFPLGAGLYQLMQLLLVVLHKKTVARVGRAGLSRENLDLELASSGAFARFHTQMCLFHLYDSSVLAILKDGGPLSNLFFRSLGARVHMDAFVECRWLYDYEQVEVGHGAALNALSSCTPHVIVSCAAARLQRIAVAPGATVWPRAMLLGETWLPPSAQLGPLSRMEPRSAAQALQASKGPVLDAHELLLGVSARSHAPHPPPDASLLV